MTDVLEPVCVSHVSLENTRDRGDPEEGFVDLEVEFLVLDGSGRRVRARRGRVPVDADLLHRLWRGVDTRKNSEGEVIPPPVYRATLRLPSAFPRELPELLELEEAPFEGREG